MSNTEAIILDSNVLIYSASPGDKRNVINKYLNSRDIVLFASEITRLEVFGYHRLLEIERKGLVAMCESITFIPISQDIINQAILLRQQKRMSLADSIIAATCQVHDVELCTYNVNDFKHLEIKLSELPDVS